MDLSDDNVLFENVQKGDINSFSVLFKRYYPGLCSYASSILNDNNLSEELVQDFFLAIWEKRGKILIDTSVKYYFLRSIKNRCINLIKKRNLRVEYLKANIKYDEIIEKGDEEYIDFELFENIEKSIRKLPEKRREVFILSRQDGLKYHEIAEKLNLSVKTVEAHMGLALKSLREMLKDYLRD